MNFLIQIPASLIQVHPCYIIGEENKGIIFLPPNEDSYAETIGAQCKYCNNIIWTTGRDNEVLNEPTPNFSNRKDYINYHKNKINRYFFSLPSCPECSNHKYDLFITNIVIPRYKNGEEYDVKKLLPENFEMSNAIKEELVWWYGSKEELLRLKYFYQLGSVEHSKF